MADSRRQIPGTGWLLDSPELADSVSQLGQPIVKDAIQRVQERARRGEISATHVLEAVLATLPPTTTRLCRVLNGTGILLHTNLGRAPLSDAAIEALRQAASTTDLELDLDTGDRGVRGLAVREALSRTVPTAEAAHMVNNGAAALALAATALAAGREIVLARGELVEIGDGFRVPDLLESTGARLREVGMTNRVHLDDYRSAVGPDTAFILKVHPSNFVVSGFTSAVSVEALRGLDVPVVVDTGSGLLRPDSALPHEPDAQSLLAQGASLVTCSGDKLLGGPQAGLLLGRADIVRSLRKHPLARALRADKLTFAALEATLRGPEAPTSRMLHQSPERLMHRANRLADDLAAAGVPAVAETSAAAVGGGGAPGVTLSSAAVTLPERYAKSLRTGDPPVLAHVAQSRCRIDLFAIAERDDEILRTAVLAAR